MKQKWLAILLERLKNKENPGIMLEQYPLPSDIAASMLNYAFYYKDIENKVVADFGCGNGKLAIGAALLNARKVYGIDIDEEMIKIAKENQKIVEELINKKLSIEWVCCEISKFAMNVDTILQNPPYGTKIRHSDIYFLEQASKISKVTYSLHKSSTRDFILKFVEKLGGRASLLSQYDLKLPRIFEFHKKRFHAVKVDLFRIAWIQGSADISFE